MTKKTTNTTVEKWLKRLSQENPDIRTEAVYKLEPFQRQSKKALKAIMDSLEDNDANVRSAAVNVLSHIGTSKAADKIIPLLKDNDSAVRWEAADALGFFRTKKSVPYLVTALNDNEKLVRLNAADSLGCLGDKRAISALVGLLKDSDPLVRGYAACALGEIGDKKVVPNLQAMLNGERSKTSKVRILVALYYLEDTSKLKEILKMLDATDYRVRCTTADSLAEIANRETYKDILKALQYRLKKESPHAVAVISAIRDSINEIRKKFKK